MCRTECKLLQTMAFTNLHKRVSQSCAERSSAAPKRGLASLACKHGGGMENAGRYSVGVSNPEGFFFLLSLISFFRVRPLVLGLGLGLALGLG